MGHKPILSGLALGAVLVWLFVFSFPDNQLHLIFCDVGQGDAILIARGFGQILIDGGPNDKVLQCLANNLPFFDRTIEIVALTHPEADHMTGMNPVMEKYRVGYFLTGPEGNSSATYAALMAKLQSLKASKMKVVNIYAGGKIKMGEIELQTLWPEEEWVRARVDYETASANFGDGMVLGAKTTDTKLNDFSLVFLLKYKKEGSFRALLMGDADSRVDSEIMGGNELEPVSILKFPHHGSKTGITEAFLRQIQPKEAVVSVGRNSYGHPTAEALDLLKKYQVKIRRTDLEGEIHYNF